MKGKGQQEGRGRRCVVILNRVVKEVSLRSPLSKALKELSDFITGI